MDETQLVGSLISPVGLSYDSLSFFFTDEADETLLTETEDTCKASQRRISPDGGLLSRNKNNALNSQRKFWKIWASSCSGKDLSIWRAQETSGSGDLQCLQNKKHGS